MGFIGWCVAAFGGLTFFMFLAYGVGVYLASSDKSQVQGLGSLVLALGHLLAIPWGIGLMALCAKWGAEQAIVEYLKALPPT